MIIKSSQIMLCFGISMFSGFQVIFEYFDFIFVDSMTLLYPKSYSFSLMDFEYKSNNFILFSLVIIQFLSCIEISAFGDSKIQFKRSIMIFNHSYSIFIIAIQLKLCVGIPTF